MNRRGFVASAGIAATVMTHKMIAHAHGTPTSSSKTFKLKYAPHDGMFKHHAGDDIVEQINFAAEQGFTAWEDNNFAWRDKAEQTRMAKAFEKNNMTMGVLVLGMPQNFWSDQIVFLGEADAPREAFLELIKSQISSAKRVGATWATVVPGYADKRLPTGFQTAKAIELMQRACDIAEPEGLTLVLEPLNTRTDHPGLFLTTVAQAYALCEAVDRPSCKILYDIYHEQIESGHIIPTIDEAWDHTAYYQVADNPGRKEPGTGELNYQNIFKHLHAKGYQGVIGMEHGNSIEGKTGEQAVIKAYRHADSF